MVAAWQLQQCVTTLWSLVGSCRDGHEPAERRAAAEAAAAALASAGGPLQALHLAENGGALQANGVPLPLDVPVFAAASGLAALLRDLDLDYVCFDGGVAADELLAWGERCAAAQQAGRPLARPMLAPLGPSVHDAGRRVSVADTARTAGRRDEAGEQTDSRLRSVFLQFHLMHGLGSDGLVPPGIAKVVVQAIVDRLLLLPGGLEPLMLLQRDPARLRRATEVAVLAVVIARTAGWPDDRLADVGGAALLHDLGAVLDARRPGPAGFRWLLQRGSDDFWLRAALVSRWWRDDQVVGGSDGLTDAGTAAVVRLATILAAATARGEGSATVRDRLRAGAAEPLAPELVAVADAALAALG
ncbi:MAG: hypothetical protein JNL08_09375 [Planctomycetes bacterium]|nr:hypothetical protein [Planctomycetota bacterium]